jgi:hypothetical protein
MNKWNKILDKCPNCGNNNPSYFISNEYTTFCSMCGYYVSCSIYDSDEQRITNPYGVLRFSDSNDNRNVRTIATEEHLNHIIDNIKVMENYKIVILSRYINNKYVEVDLFAYIRAQKIKKIKEKMNG